jgi:hypothetical protein
MAAIEHVTPWLADAIAEMVLPEDPATLCLADFGCAEGRNSIAVMRQLVAALRARTDRPIQTVHSDLPTNDFAHLMALLRPDGHSVFAASDVYSAAVGGSMYDTLLPPGSVHVATTFNAIGFASERPVERLPGFIIANGSTVRGTDVVDAADRRKFAERARADVEALMAARAAELVPGGKLLIQVFGANEIWRTSDGIFDALNDALLEVLDAGLIDRDTYERYYHPVYMRTLDELVAPLDDPESPCAKLFELDRAETYEAPMDFVVAFRHDGDVERYARDFVGFFRVFSESSLRLSLAGCDRLDDLVDDIYARAERLVRSYPDHYEAHYIAIAALMTRCDG